jgi:hypothetical protein
MGGPIWPECVGSGYCCKKAPCAFAVAKRYPIEHWLEGGKGCPALREIKGRYWCGLYLDAAGAKKANIERELAIGAGCCSSMNSDRQAILRKERHGKR